MSKWSSKAKVLLASAEEDEREEFVSSSYERISWATTSLKQYWLQRLSCALMIGNAVVYQRAVRASLRMCGRDTDTRGVVDRSFFNRTGAWVLNPGLDRSMTQTVEGIEL